MYDSDLKAKWDYENSIDFAKEVAEHEAAIKIARKMKEGGISVAQISKFTSLSIEEIEKL